MGSPANNQQSKPLLVPPPVPEDAIPRSLPRDALEEDQSQPLIPPPPPQDAFVENKEDQSNPLIPPPPPQDAIRMPPHTSLTDLLQSQVSNFAQYVNGDDDSDDI